MTDQGMFLYEAFESSDYINGVEAVDSLMGCDLGISARKRDYFSDGVTRGGTLLLETSTRDRYSSCAQV
jgi:hypothetical protein